MKTVRARYGAACSARLQNDGPQHCAVIEAAIDGFWRVSQDGRILEVNDAYCRMSGYRRKELLGMRISEIEAAESAAEVAKRIANVIRRGYDRFDTVHRRKDGSLLMVEASVQMMPTGDGQIFGFFKDISENKHAEEARKASELKHRRLYESMTDAYVVVAMTGEIQEYNQVYRDMLGYPDKELSRLTYKDLTPKKWHAMEARIVREQILPLGHSQVYEKEYRRKDGAIIPVELRTFLIRDEQGRAAGMWAIIREISRRKRAEKQILELNETLEKRVRERTTELERTVAALRESERHLRSVITAAPVILWDVDARGTILLSEGNALERIGLKPTDRVGKSVFEIYKNNPEAIALVQRGLGGETFSAEVTGGGRVWNNHFVPRRDGRGKVTGLVVVSLDITEHKRAEEARFEALSRFEGFSKASQYGMGMADLDGNILFANPTLARMLGEQSTDDCLGKHFPSTYYGPESALKIQKEIMPALMRDGHWHGELELISRDGRKISTEENYFIIRDEEGRTQYFADILTDITKRKQQEEELRRSQALLKSVTEGTPDAIFVKDLHGHYVMVNSAAARFLRRPIKEIAGKDDREFFPAEHARSAMEEEHRILKTGAVENFESTFILDGKTVTFQTTKGPMLDANGKVAGIFGIARDITERVQLERKILEISDRERRLIGQDLHDGLGQFLVGASYLAGSLQKDLAAKFIPEAARLGRIQELINEAITQARNLTRSLHPVEPEPNALMVALGNLAANTKDLFGIHCNFQCRLPVLIRDNHVANHLFWIAREAVTNALKHGKAKRIQIRLAPTSAGIRLTINDNGEGLQAQHHKKRGMGLQIMRYRANIIGGTLTVQEGAGGGTIIVCNARHPNHNPSDHKQTATVKKERHARKPKSRG